MLYKICPFSVIKADMKSFIQLETTAIFFLKQSISSKYVIVDFIGMGLLDPWGERTKNYKMKILAYVTVGFGTFRLRSEHAKHWAIRADIYHAPKGDYILPEFAIKSYLYHVLMGFTVK